MMFGGDPATIRCQRCRRVLARVMGGEDDVLVLCACWTSGLPTGGKVQRRGSVPGQAVAAAAERILEGKANQQHKIILRHLLAAGERGLTQPELALCEGVDSRAHRTRRLELTEAGLVRANGATRRITYTDEKGELVRGKNAHVYVLTPAGEREAARWV